MSAPLLTTNQFTSPMISATPFRIITIQLGIVPHSVPIKRRSIGRAATRDQVFASKINAFACDRHHSDYFWAKPRSGENAVPIAIHRTQMGNEANFTLGRDTAARCSQWRRKKRRRMERVFFLGHKFEVERRNTHDEFRVKWVDPKSPHGTTFLISWRENEICDSCCLLRMAQILLCHFVTSQF